MLPILIEQVRDATERRFYRPAPELPQRRTVRRAVAAGLHRAGHRLDPSLHALHGTETV